MEISEYKVFSAEEVLPLYESAGWTAYTSDPVGLKKGFEGSLCVLAAYEDGKLLGLIRTVGDGSTVILIQDILVYPQWRRRGIGTELLKAVIERYRHVRQIQLVTDNAENTLAFYRSAGFEKLEKIGCCGLMWTDKA